jgi:hypothetical protein
VATSYRAPTVVSRRVTDAVLVALAVTPALLCDTINAPLAFAATKLGELLLNLRTRLLTGKMKTG